MSATMPIDQVVRQLESLTTAFVAMAKVTGARLTRAEVCERLGIHRNTLASYMDEKDFPTPTLDGKWLLGEVVEWEARR